MIESRRPLLTPEAAPPTAHASTHASAGADPVTPAAIGASATGHTHTATAISDSTAASRAVMTAANTAAIRTAAGVGATGDAVFTAATPPAAVAALASALPPTSLALRGGTTLGASQECGRVYFDPATYARAGRTTVLTLEVLMDASTNLTHTAILRNLTAGANDATIVAVNETTVAPSTRHIAVITTPGVATVWELRGSHNGALGVDTATLSGATLWITWS